MNEPDPARTLLGELQAGLRALAKLESFLLAYERDSLRTERRGTEQALALTQALGNYYTIDYDWEKLDYLLTKFKQVAQPVRHELDAFAQLLESLGRDGVIR